MSRRFWYIRNDPQANEYPLVLNFRWMVEVHTKTRVRAGGFWNDPLRVSIRNKLITFGV